MSWAKRWRALVEEYHDTVFTFVYVVNMFRDIHEKHRVIRDTIVRVIYHQTVFVTLPKNLRAWDIFVGMKYCTLVYIDACNKSPTSPMRIIHITISFIHKKKVTNVSSHAQLLPQISLNQLIKHVFQSQIIYILKKVADSFPKTCLCGNS